MNWLPSKYVPEVVDEYPDLEKAIPGLSSLPQMWKAGLRAYHRATVRDMIRKATQFQLDLLIEPAHDCPTKFTPIQIHNVNGNWMVEGRGATGVIRKFPLDQIKRLQDHGANWEVKEWAELPCNFYIFLT